jgi:hypothetical protein
VGLNRSAGASMANDEHVAILKQGVDAWNKWRVENRHLRPDLSGADLSRANLFLERMAFRYLDAYLDANRPNYDRWARPDWRQLVQMADLSGANLAGANLIWAKLFRANLSGADLTSADLTWADLTGADLIGAELTDANVTGADLTWADLTGADLTRAELCRTVFGFTVLTEVKGLEHCFHLAPSIIDFQTLKWAGPLPVAFLRGIGLPDPMIEYLPSLLNTAIQHYSCFISYSSKDQAFADRLHADLQNKGVRCWFAPHDMRIGAKIIDALDEAIRLRDKVLLILSDGAIASDWVEGEVTRALDEERTRKQVVLFPVRIDDAVMQTSEAWARLLRGQRNIGDFTRWKEHDGYQKSFERLMRDLRIEKPGQ